MAAALGLTGLGALWTVGCGAEMPPEPDMRADLLRSWGEHVILPTFASFEEKTAQLRDASAALCESPSDETLEGAQTRWWEARAPWKRSQIFAFGPYEEEPLRLGPKIDFWPPRPLRVRDLLQGTGALAEADVAAMGAAERGMPAVEQLLYDEAEPPGEVFVGRRCEYLLAATEDLHTSAAALREAWDPEGGNYLAELTKPGHGKMFESIGESLSEVVNRMVFTLENARLDKLGRPLGDQAGGVPQPDLAESHFSGRSTEDLRDHLRGILALYDGGDDPEELGLVDYAAARGYDVDAEMHSLVKSADEALRSIEPSLTLAVIEDPDQVRAAQTALEELQRFIQVDVINALGLTVNFNDNDGD